MAQYYYIGPWVWHTALEPEGECWAAPEGTVGSIDLRPYEACGLRGIVQGVGLFVTDRPFGSDYTLIASDLTEVLKPTSKSAFETVLRTAKLSSVNFRDCVTEILDLRADPDQGRMCAGLGVTRAGNQEIYLGPHGRIWQSHFGGLTDPAWPMVQAKYQRAYRSIRSQALAEAAATRALREGLVPDLNTPERGLYLRVAALAAKSKTAFDGVKETLARYAEETHLRYLSTLVEKMSLDPRLFVPGDLPYEGIRAPQTTQSESFNKADDGLGPDLTWTTTVGNWKVVSNQAEATSADSSAHEARADADVSSSDHVAQMDAINAASNNSIGVAARFSASARTHYVVEICTGWTSTERIRLGKRIDGVGTNLTKAAATISYPDVLAIEVDGDALKGYLNAVEKTSTTDTSISGNTRGGIDGWQYLVSRPRPTLDNFSISDLGAPPAGAVGLMLKETELGNSLLRGLIHAA